MKIMLMVAFALGMLSTSIFAADTETITQSHVKEFRAAVDTWGGLCGNLKVFCGFVMAEGEPAKHRKEIESRVSLETFADAGKKARRENELRTVVVVESGTVADALNKLVQADPRYEWTLDNGVINILPKLSYRHLENGQDPLDRKIKSLEISSMPSEQAAQLILRASGLVPGGREQAGPRQAYGTVSLSLKDISLREALNSLVKADGQANWGLEYTEYKNYVVDIYSWRPAGQLFRGSGAQNKK